MQIRLTCLAVLLILTAFSGCGNGNVPLSGTVTFTDDNAPVEVGTIVFTDGKQQARGELGPGGKFKLGFVKANDGLPKGSYKVYITGAVKKEDREVPNPRPGVSYYTETQLIDSKYESQNTSGLTFVVDGTTKTATFKVDRATGTAAVPKNREFEGRPPRD